MRMFLPLALLLAVACQSQPSAQPPGPQLATLPADSISYAVVNTGQPGSHGLAFHYQINPDSTVLDLVTGLQWQRGYRAGLRYDEVAAHIDTLTLGGYSDWRLPTLKELLSLADFRGNEFVGIPYLDTASFVFAYPAGPAYIFQPDPSTGLRRIDVQFVSADDYRGRIMRGDEGVFGFNFADGHVKCYPKYKHPQRVPTYHVRAVRGNPYYGHNRFQAHVDGTVTDFATGLMWQQTDDGIARDWDAARQYADTLTLGGYTDWYLPDIKELHTLTDYTRIPALAQGLSSSTAQAWFWSSSVFAADTNLALYVAFGPAVDFRGTDTHGAGAIRGDFKRGDPTRFPQGFGPQRDQVRIRNQVRAVRRAGQPHGG